MPPHLRLYNTLTRSIEPFRPRDPSRITFYTCGPTVYDDAHIGNFRSFLAADVLRRFLESSLCRVEGVGIGVGVADGSAQASPEHGLQSRATQDRPTRVVHVMNITDVGHMTDDDQADGGGEDKMQAAARRLLDAKKSGKLPPGAEGVDPTDQLSIARFYEARFREDARRLGLKVAIEAQNDPTLMPRATESVPGMIAVIARLIERGFAYAVGPAGRQTVYFSVQSFPQYGTLSGNTLDALRSGEGGRVQESHQAEKRHPADFLLWKSDPSHAMKWESPWGAGYPGWHIECSAMSAARLLAADGRGPLSPDELSRLVIPGGGPMIDLHSGGEDNIFPHHECEIAQSCGAFNATPREGDAKHGLYAAHWFHPRFLMVEGAKMSKSKGNFFTPRDLIARGHEPAAIRLELIKTHYRSNANFTEQGLKDSARMYRRWINRISAIADVLESPAYRITSDGDYKRVFPNFVLTAHEVAERMHDDLNVALAIASLNEGIETAASQSGAALAEPVVPHVPSEVFTRVEAGFARFGGADWEGLFKFGHMISIFGLTDCADPPRAATTDIGVFIPPATPTPEVSALLTDRAAARAAKDFKRSDTIRDQLAAMGYAIKDVAGGKVEVRRL